MMNSRWMKRLAAAGAALMIAGAFAGCGGEKKSETAPSGGAASAKIGVLEAVTGPGAAYGIAMKEGVDLAVEDGTITAVHVSKGDSVREGAILVTIG